MDYNITGRADFSTKAHSTPHLHHPNNPETSKFSLNLEDNQIFSVKEITVSCIAGYKGFIPYPPPESVLVTIPGILDEFPCGPDSVKTVKNFIPFQAIDINNREVTIISPSFFEIKCSLEGMLFTLKDGCTLSHKECVGFAMLDHNNQGRTILDEGRKLLKLKSCGRALTFFSVN